MVWNFGLKALLAGSHGNGRVVSALPRLPRGEFVMTHTRDRGPGPLTFVATPRATPHIRHLGKYADSCVSPEQAFVFRRPEGQVVGVADSLASFRHTVAGLDHAVLAHHAGRHDFSRWMRDVFSDQKLAALVRKVEARWTRGEIADLREALDRLVALRYGPGS